MTSLWYLKTLTDISPFYTVSIVDFEQVLFLLEKPFLSGRYVSSKINNQNIMDIHRYFVVNIGVNLHEIIACKLLILPLHTQLTFTCSKLQQKLYETFEFVLILLLTLNISLFFVLLLVTLNK